jgi:hypothetical protein
MLELYYLIKAMSTTLESEHQPAPVAPAEAPNPVLENIPPIVQEAGRFLGHNAVLRVLLDERYITPESPLDPGNYETARDSGLLDAFYFDPKTGQDAIVHILSGDTWTDSETGAQRVSGFHHETSTLSADTGANLERVAKREEEGKAKGKFDRYPYEPYRTYVDVEGYRRDSPNTMFPSEYDGLAVLQTIKKAWDTRDSANYKDASSPDNVMVDVDAPLLDGETTFPVRLILDRKTEKIISAMPLVKKQLMDLSDQDIQGHLGLEDNQPSQ